MRMLICRAEGSLSSTPLNISKGMREDDRSLSEGQTAVILMFKTGLLEWWKVSNSSGLVHDNGTNYPNFMKTCNISNCE